MSRWMAAVMLLRLGVDSRVDAAPAGACPSKPVDDSRPMQPAHIDLGQVPGDCPSVQEPNVAFQTDERSTQGALTAISQGMWTGVQMAARELTPRHTDELMERRAAWMRTSGAQRLAERSQNSYADYVAACDDARLDLVRKEVFSSQDSIHTRLRAWSSLVAASHLWLPSNRYCS